ncbi:MAG: kinesin-like protein [Faunusvirus sp.]|jgi:hypothetical protein|uniref:Kinesin-like protein n=1 Tax=Faunusvirus sp. TaxID=2487766 RepID=A0A3G4ZWP1_9VIRU|nr:MAG: kinesin-like protein [Faunusvirus sp.]
MDFDKLRASNKEQLNILYNVLLHKKHDMTAKTRDKKQSGGGLLDLVTGLLYGKDNIASTGPSIEIIDEILHTIHDKLDGDIHLYTIDELAYKMKQTGRNIQFEMKKLLSTNIQTGGQGWHLQGSTTTRIVPVDEKQPTGMFHDIATLTPYPGPMAVPDTTVASKYYIMGTNTEVKYTGEGKRPFTTLGNGDAKKNISGDEVMNDYGKTVSQGRLWTITGHLPIVLTAINGLKQYTNNHNNYTAIEIEPAPDENVDDAVYYLKGTDKQRALNRPRPGLHIDPTPFIGIPVNPTPLSIPIFTRHRLDEIIAKNEVETKEAKDSKEADEAKKAREAKEAQEEADLLDIENFAKKIEEEKKEKEDLLKQVNDHINTGPLNTPIININNVSATNPGIVVLPKFSGIDMDKITIPKTITTTEIREAISGITPSDIGNINKLRIVDKNMLNKNNAIAQTITDCETYIEQLITFRKAVEEKSKINIDDLNVSTGIYDEKLVTNMKLSQFGEVGQMTALPDINSIKVHLSSLSDGQTNVLNKFQQIVSRVEEAKKINKIFAGDAKSSAQDVDIKQSGGAGEELDTFIKFIDGQELNVAELKHIPILFSENKNGDYNLFDIFSPENGVKLDELHKILNKNKFRGYVFYKRMYNILVSNHITYDIIDKNIIEKFRANPVELREIYNKLFEIFTACGHLFNLLDSNIKNIPVDLITGYKTEIIALINKPLRNIIENIQDEEFTPDSLAKVFIELFFGIYETNWRVLEIDYLYNMYTYNKLDDLSDDRKFILTNLNNMKLLLTKVYKTIDDKYNEYKIEAGAKFKINPALKKYIMDVYQEDSNNTSAELTPLHLDVRRILQQLVAIFNISDMHDSNINTTVMNGFYKDINEKFVLYISNKNKLNEIMTQLTNEIFAYSVTQYRTAALFNYLSTLLHNDGKKYRIYNYYYRRDIRYYLDIIEYIKKGFTENKHIGDGNLYIKFYLNGHLVDLFDTLFRKILDLADDKQLVNNVKHQRIFFPDRSTEPTRLVKSYFSIFNRYRLVLDKFYAVAQYKIAIYLRINDYNSSTTTQNGDRKMLYSVGNGCYTLDENGKCDYDADKLLFRPVNNADITQLLIDPSKCDAYFKGDAYKKQKLYLDKKELENEKDIPRYIGDIDNKRQYKDIDVGFKKVYSTDDYKSATNIAQELCVAPQLSSANGMMFFTYGYSGTGKTFTLAGSARSKQSGLLQASLKLVENIETIYFRTYEIYGYGTQYSDLSWNKPEGVCQMIIPYTVDIDAKVPKMNATVDAPINELFPIEYKNGQFTAQQNPNFKAYLADVNKICELNDTKNTKYIQLDTDNYNHLIDNFSEFMDKIDEQRKNPDQKSGLPKRISTTPNNPESSRSILVYEFQLKIKDEDDMKKPAKCVPFILFDLPGKEEIIDTYVTHNKFNIKKDDYKQLGKYAAMSANPLALPIYYSMADLNNEIPVDSQEDVDILRKFANFIDILGYKMSEFITLTPQKTSSGKVVIKFNYKPEAHEAVMSNNDLMYNTYLQKFMMKTTAPNLSTNPQLQGRMDMYHKYVLLQLLIFLISSNMFNIIQHINKILINKDAAMQNVLNTNKYTEYSIQPYEGIYINENVGGLIKYLSEIAYTGSPSSNSEILKIVGKQSETPFYMQQNIVNMQYKASRVMFYTTLAFLKDNIGTQIPALQADIYKFIYGWMMDTYDSNKIYKWDNPAITTVFKNYRNISSYKLLYLLTNNDNSTKCDKQLSLLSNTAEFIDNVTKQVKPKE